MNVHSSATGEQLVNALHTLGVNFIMGGESKEERLGKQPARLLAALAQSSEARLRLALIPLFLEHPEFAMHARTVANHLDPAARLTLQCYYTAAHCLEQTLAPRRKSLPDFFSGELGLSFTNNPEENLRALANRHQELSGARVNWLGTYHHAVQVWQKGQEFQEA